MTIKETQTVNLYLDKQFQLNVKIMKIKPTAINFQSTISKRYFWLPRKALFENAYSYTLKNWFNGSDDQIKIFEQDKRERNDPYALSLKETDNSTNWDSFNPSNYQSNILNFALQKNKNIQVDAAAGSGKSTTLAYMLNYLKGNILLLSFTTAAVGELKEKIKLPNVDIRTIDSLSFLLCRSNNPGIKIEVDESKIFNYLLNSHLDPTATKEEEDQFYSLVFPTIKLVNSVQSFGIRNPDNDNLQDLMLEQDINVKKDLLPIVLMWTIDAIAYTRKTVNTITVNDMSDLAFYHSYTTNEHYDYILVDEDQDLNAAQMEIIYNIMDPDTIFVGVGDTNQAIFAWRGSSTKSVQQISEIFETINFPLPVSYRQNNLNIVEYINKVLPHIEHLPKDNAKYGDPVQHIDYSEFYNLVTDQDMVISRTNAAMIGPVWMLINSGKKAYIAGKEIGEDLIKFIKRFTAENDNDVYKVIDAITLYKIETVEKLKKRGKENTAQIIEDNANASITILEQYNDINKAYDFIRNVFSNDKNGIEFRTIHKAKGSQCKRVFVLESNKLETTQNLLPEDYENFRQTNYNQEINASYVAFSRAIDSMYLVN